MTNVRKWVVDSGTTKHIRKQKCVYLLRKCGDGEEQVYLGDSRTTPVLGKGKVLLKLTSGKTLALSNVLHVPSIIVNLISIALLSKVGVKVSFEYEKINVFVENGYCDQDLFVLNIFEVINESESFAYIVDFYDIWHARLGHVNYSYVMKLQRLGLINMHEKQNNKCDI